MNKFGILAKIGSIFRDLFEHGNIGPFQDKFNFWKPDDIPSLVIRSNSTGADPVTGPVQFTFDFSEPVNGFDIGCITVTDGAKDLLQQVTNTSYSLEVIPRPNNSGIMTVSVAAGCYTNLAGEAGRAAKITQPFNTIQSILIGSPPS
ncbi:MAG: Ig-like domain-containing protein, partial [Candidatus Falkowbacteria bacterium]